MKLARLYSAGLLVSVFGLIFAAAAYGSGNIGYHGSGTVEYSIVKTPTDGGIREDVPRKYQDRYDRWKAELLSTEFGRDLWASFATKKDFVLTIKVDGDKGKGGGTDKFQWDKDGNLVGATITIGHQIDDGYPNPIYYPVLNSLSTQHTSYVISGKILAASKISHELGHVAQTAKANMEVLERQSKLIPQYTSIFLKNGHNTKDEKLVALVEQLGGTPVEIWESREYWSEVTAMGFLNERLKDENYRCSVFGKIRSNVELYARDYVERFSDSWECK